MNNVVVTKWPFQSEYQAKYSEVSAVNQSGRTDWFHKWPILLSLINSRDWIQTLLGSSWSPGVCNHTDREC